MKKSNQMQSVRSRGNQNRTSHKPKSPLLVSENPLRKVVFNVPGQSERLAAFLVSAVGEDWVELMVEGQQNNNVSLIYFDPVTGELVEGGWGNGRAGIVATEAAINEYADLSFGVSPLGFWRRVVTAIKVGAQGPITE
jgi:hypothetical protein